MFIINYYFFQFVERKGYKNKHKMRSKAKKMAADFLKIISTRMKNHRHRKKRKEVRRYLSYCMF